MRAPRPVPQPKSIIEALRRGLAWLRKTCASSSPGAYLRYWAISQSRPYFKASGLPAPVTRDGAVPSIPVSVVAHNVMQSPFFRVSMLTVFAYVRWPAQQVQPSTDHSSVPAAGGFGATSPDRSMVSDVNAVRTLSPAAFFAVAWAVITAF